MKHTHASHVLPLILLATALFAAPGCRSGPRKPDLEALYRSSVAEQRAMRTTKDFEDYDDHELERRAQVWRAVQDGVLETPEDQFWAAAVLVDSSDLEQVGAARDLALDAAESGLDRGFPVAAKAIDRLALLEGRPQPYGTQYVFERVLKEWVLYEVDPLTSDVERTAMGVPTLAEARARAARLNEVRGVKD